MNKVINVSLLDELVNEVPYYKGGEINVFGDDIKKKIFERDLYKCCLCSSDEKILAHHKIPKGEAIVSNGITLCFDCHICVHTMLSLYRGYPYYILSEIRKWGTLGGVNVFWQSIIDRMVEKHKKEIERALAREQTNLNYFNKILAKENKTNYKLSKENKCLMDEINNK